jgi:hypothetical protein
MNQQSQMFAYGQLHSMSFIQLFHLCVALARRNWFLNLKAASDYRQGLHFQAAYASDFRFISGDALQRWQGARGTRDVRDSAW